MDKNLFVFVTSNGSLFNRTNGKNSRIFPQENIALEAGTVMFTKDFTGKLMVKRYNDTGKEVYTKDISEPGMYMISEIFVQPLIRSSKEVRNLYNRLKTSLGQPKFKIEVKPKLRQPFKITMHTWLDKGFKYRFIINTKEENISLEMVDEIYNLVDRASRVNLRMLLSYYGAFNDTGVMVTINETFFDELNELLAGIGETASSAM